MYKLSQAKHNHEKAAAPREEQFIRFKTYGDASKQPLVIVPGLDGVTAFFSDIVPELTLNVRAREGDRSRNHRGGEREADRDRDRDTDKRGRETDNIRGTGCAF